MATDPVPANPWRDGGARGATIPAVGTPIPGAIVYEWVGADGKTVLDPDGTPSRDICDFLDDVPDPAEVNLPWATIWRWCPASELTG